MRHRDTAEKHYRSETKSDSASRGKSVVLRVAKGWMPKILRRFQRVFALMCWPGFVEGNSQGESLFMERLRAPLWRYSFKSGMSMSGTGAGFRG